ncbi:MULTISPECIES: hypothetical protein [Methylobacterium]|uniref:Uncharacterized protein n=1 Tax=Methylobacterium longum TaxID=767694 RepID=A0ABT8AVW5_9HYPH|nr:MULTISPECIES: hypothetical protein [Methylobacterium]MCJ2102253.1 hypothetical protein [Methylobacterium sp. E-046]MDN3573626.1 hypothetical protein [Methylobacterium longum]GJE15027.1 hypothetical protein FOHLNKBM_6104 [Methylobacterium longum]
MTVRMLAAAALVAAVATPALAQGLDSKHAPYPASAYSGWVGNAPLASRVPAAYGRPPAYRYAGSHAGGPANALPRY